MIKVIEIFSNWKTGKTEEVSVYINPEHIMRARVKEDYTLLTFVNGDTMTIRGQLYD